MSSLQQRGQAQHARIPALGRLTVAFWYDQKGLNVGTASLIDKDDERNTPMEITDKVAVITGASGGIGLATARLFAERGARVVLVARSAERIQQLAAELPGALAAPADMRDTAAVRGLIAQVQQHYGCIDILMDDPGPGHACAHR